MPHHCCWEIHQICSEQMPSHEKYLLESLENFVINLSLGSVAKATEMSLLGNNLLIYLVRNEQLNENCHIKFPMVTYLAWLVPRTVWPFAWTFGSTVQHKMIQVSLL